MTADGVTVLGAGRIGVALASRWLAAGWKVTVWNRTAGKAVQLADIGARVAVDLPGAVAGAGIVVSVLTDGAAVTDTLVRAGALRAMAAGTLLVELSTIDQDSSRAVAEAAGSAGVRYVRGALSGSPAMVAAGSASALLSGDRQDLAAAAEVLKPVVSGVTVVGAAEEAKVVKLAINAMVGSAVLAVAEAMVTVDAAGVPRPALVEALQKSAVWSPVVAYKAIALRDGDEQITATVADLLKDIELVDVQQRETAVHAPVTRSILQVLQRAADSGLEAMDCSAVTALLQADSGLRSACTEQELSRKAPPEFSEGWIKENMR